jgi:hypothetical protein
MEKKRTQVPQKSARVDILPISIYLVVVLYRHKHCRPQKVELDLACRDSTTTKVYSDGLTFKYFYLEPHAPHALIYLTPRP